MGLYLAKSGIPNSGKGLFTSKASPNKAKICDYTGKMMSTKKWNEGGKGDYGVQIRKKLVMDGRSTQSALGRYANHCRSKNKKKKQCSGINAKFSINQQKKTVSVRAKKNIPAHSEIFVSYGKEYWG